LSARRSRWSFQRSTNACSPGSKDDVELGSRAMPRTPVPLGEPKINRTLRPERDRPRYAGARVGGPDGSLCRAHRSIASHVDRIRRGTPQRSRHDVVGTHRRHCEFAVVVAGTVYLRAFRVLLRRVSGTLGSLELCGEHSLQWEQCERRKLQF
jgi:hypothetical protein